MNKQQINLIKYITGALLVLPLWVTGQNIVWEQTYVIPDDQSIVALAKADTGYLAFGQARNLVEFSEVIKIDTAGQLLWRKAIFSDPAISRSYSFDMKKVPDEENYYVAGFFRRNGPRDYLVKINSQGDTLWTFLHEPLNALFQTTRKIITLKDKSVVTVGFQEQAGSQEDVFVRRIDSTGQLMWDEIYSLPGNQRGYDITEMMDGSLIMAGRNSGDNLLLRIGFDGRLIDTFSKSPNTGNLWANHILVNQSNELIVDSYSSPNGSNFVGELFKVDMKAKQTIWSRQFGLGINAPAVINSDSNIFVDWIPNPGNLTLSKKEYNGITSIWDFPYTNGSKSVRVIESMMFDKNDKMLVGGYLDTLSSNNYWLAKIDGVGEEWIQDPCAFSPPIAGFAYDFNGGIFTLLDTSYAGLPYLDTLYTWDWTLSNGFTSNLESPVTLLDTSSTKTLDIQLIVSNWYGCKDTINQTLNFGPTGITSDIQFEEKVWPNPARDILNISLSERPNQNVLFEVFDVHGRKQLQNSFSGKEGNLNISTLASGIYFYKLSSGGVVKRGKVVKE